MVLASRSSGAKSSRGESSRYPSPFGGVRPRRKGLGEYERRLKQNQLLKLRITKSLISELISENVHRTNESLQKEIANVLNHSQDAKIYCCTTTHRKVY